MDVLSICVVTVFALWGLGEFIRTLVIFICNKSSPKNTCILIVPIKGKCEQAEFILRSAAQQVRYGKQNIIKKIVCVLEKPDSQTEKICRGISKEYSFMEVIYLSELQNIFY
ncbi:MAG: hypothetical protein ACI4W1_04685 [Ruminococcus sp.]